MKRPWPKVKLGEVLRHTPRPVKPAFDATYREIGIRSHGKGIFHKPPVTGAEIGDKKVFAIEPGDFILNIVFAWEGAVAVAGPNEAGMIGSHRFPTFRADTGRLDVRLLPLYLRTPEGLELLGRVSPGGAGRNRTLNRTAFLGQEIPLQPLDEQHRLVAIIEEQTQRINQVRALRAESATALDDSLVAIVHRLDMSNADKVAGGWRRMALKDCLRLVADVEQVASDGTYPNLGVFSFGRGLFPKPAIEGFQTSAKSLCRVHSGQFIYSRLFASEGAYGVVTDEYDGCYVSNEYPTFECDASILRIGTLACHFKALTTWREVATGSKGIGHRRQRVQFSQGRCSNTRCGFRPWPYS